MTSEQTLSPLFTWRSAIVESGLSSTCRLVALTLSLHMNERGGSCFPSVDTLASETGLTARSVQVNVAKLELAGWLVVRRGGGRGRANTYAAHIPERANVVPGIEPQTPQEKPRIRNSEPEAKGASDATKGERRRDKGGTTFTRGRHEVVKEDVPPAPNPARETAEGVVNKHWEASTPKPAVKWIALVQIVQRFVDAGYPEPEIAKALRSTRAYTVDAIEFTLRHAKAEPPVTTGGATTTDGKTFLPGTGWVKETA